MKIHADHLNEVVLNSSLITRQVKDVLIDHFESVDTPMDELLDAGMIR